MPKFCFYDDDLTQVFTRLADCDVLLFGSPIFFDSVSGQAKSFIDRCNCFRPPDYDGTQSERWFVKILSRKRPGVMVLVGGRDGWFEGARRVVAGFFKWVEVTNEGSLMFRSDDFNRVGTAIDDPQVMLEAADIGRRLAIQVIDSTAPDDGTA